MLTTHPSFHPILIFLPCLYTLHLKTLTSSPKLFPPVDLKKKKTQTKDSCMPTATVLTAPYHVVNITEFSETRLFFYEA